MPRFDPRHLLTPLAGRLPARLLVAFSGGLDSSVLLHALYRLCGEGLLGKSELLALHVNHGLLPEAERWAGHCADFAAGRGIAFRCLEVKEAPPAGGGLEAWAREHRYRLLAAEMERGDLLLTAHHRDDQAETVLLRLLRGSGPGGIAAMRPERTFAAGWLLRPLLGWERSALEAWARSEGLRWIEDRSNREPCFDRNYLRHRVLPLLEERWPDASSRLARAAHLQQEAAGLLEELAAIDLAAIGSRGTLNVAGLRALDPARLSNLLRYWALQRGLVPPPPTVLERVEAELLAAGRDRNPVLQWGEVQLRRYREQVYLLRQPPRPEPGDEYTWDLEQPLELPGGTLSAAPARGEGLRLAALQGGVSVGYRRGGEMLRPVGDRNRRALKKLLQGSGLPPWERALLPLLRVRGRLAAVADRWLEQEFAAGEGEEGMRLIWRPRE